MGVPKTPTAMNSRDSALLDLKAHSPQTKQKWQKVAFWVCLFIPLMWFALTWRVVYAQR